MPGFKSQLYSALELPEDGKLPQVLGYLSPVWENNPKVLVTCVGEPSRVPDSYAQPLQTLEVKMSCSETCVFFLIKDNLFVINTWWLYVCMGFSLAFQYLCVIRSVTSTFIWKLEGETDLPLVIPQMPSMARLKPGALSRCPMCVADTNWHPYGMLAQWPHPLPQNASPKPQVPDISLCCKLWKFRSLPWSIQLAVVLHDGPMCYGATRVTVPAAPFDRVTLPARLPPLHPS